MQPQYDIGQDTLHYSVCVAAVVGPLHIRFSVPEQEDANYNILGYVVEKVCQCNVTSHASN